MSSKSIEKFCIRSYSKQELALLYFPDCQDAHVAVNRLARWLQRCHPLCQALKDSHYCKRSKFFTPHEVELIIQFIGEP